MKILFWNTYRNRDINGHIVNLVRDYSIDVLVLAEYSANRDELSDLLLKYGHRLAYCNTLGCERIDIWSSYANMKAGIQEEYYSVQIIQDKFVLCCVHLFTDLYGDRSDERLAVIQRIMHDIEAIESEIKSRQTIIIGDINEMPYSRGCLNANGFHGLPALNINDKSTRKIKGIEYRKFYNPMWSLMGDFTYPPETIIRNSLKQIENATKGYVRGNIEEYDGPIHSYTKKVVWACRSFQRRLGLTYRKNWGRWTA